MRPRTSSRAVRNLCLAALLAGLSLPAGAAGWKAGVARTDITPQEPIWLAGYAARTKPSEGVAQKLWVKALALEDSTGAVSVMVTSDLLGFTRDMSEEVSSRAKQRFGIDRARLVLNASHTHSGPVTGQLLRPAYELRPEHETVIRRYTGRLIDQVVETIGQAAANRRPVELGFAQGFAGFAVNRRRVGHREYPGPVDHDVPVLSVREPGGRLLAVLFGYSCHATVLSEYEVSGDWPGYAQDALERRFPGTMALFVNGTGADQNPLPRRKVELAKQYGEILAEAVDQVLAAAMKPVPGPLGAAYDTLTLPMRPASRETLEQRLKSGSQIEKNHARQMLELIGKRGSLPDSYPYPLQVWRFGDALTFVSMAGEVVVDYGLRFRQRYGWENTWVSGYNNDVFAYIPSLRVLREGGYEGGGAMIAYGQPGPFGAAVEELIAEKVEELVARTRTQ